MKNQKNTRIWGGPNSQDSFPRKTATVRVKEREIIINVTYVFININYNYYNDYGNDNESRDYLKFYF